MTGFIRYQFMSYIRSFKIIPPLTLFVIWVIIFYAYRGLPIISSYAVTSTVIYLTITWIAMNIFSMEEETEKQMLFIQLGNKSRYLWGKWTICFLTSLLLMLFAISYPLLMSNFKGTIQPIQVLLSVYCHTFLSVFGILVGSFSSITSFTMKKYTWLIAVLVIVLSISYEGIVEKLPLLKWVLFIFPPVVNVIKSMGDDETVHIGTDFWIMLIWTITYTIIGFFIIGKLFLRKES
ncbi:hypothetical protein [Bacillus sp. FJAT-22090]|uniref:hypothetical protein n=1 Tax=Bacillus sp. FJAT-22090 TaxID=1581038 RepID=UPI00119FBA90|nr:hypothetical protein [Bacillus sp. FJAT-22090]